jgi:hypothetical protein
MNVAKRTVYHISPLRLWLAPGIFVIVAVFTPLLVAFDASLSDSRNIGIFMGFFFLAFGVAMYLLLRYTRLVLSADGIKLYQFGYVLETGWDNVAYLDDSPDSEGLVLHRPMDCSGAFTLSAGRNINIKGATLFSAEQLQLIAERRLIPLNPFAYWLKNGQLRDDLARREPALSGG